MAQANGASPPPNYFDAPSDPDTFPPTDATYHLSGQDPFPSIIMIVIFFIVMLLIVATVHYICPRINPLQLLPSARGIPASVLDAIPNIVVNDESEYPAGCLICWEDILPGQEIKMLPQCRHVFHAGCTYSWFSDRLGCPLCRTEPR